MKRLLSITVVNIMVLFMQATVLAQSLPTVQAVQFKKDSFNIVQYGAVAGGLVLCTANINAAIDDCTKNGGGTVLIPGGLWLSGPIVLKNNVNLHLADNALLQFTTMFNEYPLVEGNWEGLPAVRNQSPLSAANAHNIAITGKGIIDGGGDAWRAVKKEKLTEGQWQQLINSGGLLSEDKKTWYPSEKYLKGVQTKDPGVLQGGKTAKDFADIKDYLRPNLLVFTACKTILLEGITFQNSPAWCLHPLLCEDLTVRNVLVKNPWYGQNGDGIDIESCKNVLLEHSTFDVGDDGICIKSGRDAEGRKRAVPTENVTIQYCTVYHAHGGFVIGSEMSGGARNLVVTDCSFIGTDIGLRFKTTRGRGGIVEKVYVSHINMKNIAAEAILFDMYYMAKDPVPLKGEQRELPKTEFKPVDETTPILRNFHISDVFCIGALKAVFIRGLPEMPVTGIVLENMVIQASKGFDIQEAANIQCNNIQVLTADTGPVIDIVQSNHISFSNIRYKEKAVLCRINGDRTKSIKFGKTDTSKAKERLETAFNADEKEVQWQQ